MNKKKTLSLYFLLTGICTLFAVVGRILITILYWQTDVGFYQLGTPVPTLYFIFVLLCFLLLFSSLLVCRKEADTMGTMPVIGQGITFTSALCGFLLLAALLLQILYYLRGEISIASEQAAAIAITQTLNHVFQILTVIITLPAALYFFVVALRPQVQSHRLAFLSFFPLLWCVFYSMNLYFDMTTALNNPDRIFHHLSLIALMLYFLYEIRFHLGLPKPRYYFLFSYLSILFVSIYTIPNLLLMVFWTLPLSTDSIYLVVELGMLVYIITRTVSFLKTSKEAIE